MKKAIITGITGQDGSYLAELLINLGYEVHGIIRRSSTDNTERLRTIQNDRENCANLKLHYGDLTDSLNIVSLIKEIKPDEIYNLGAQSDVKISWDCSEYTANVDALGTLRLLEAIKINGLSEKTKFYQSSTSELYGLTQNMSQDEKTPFYPRSPYAVAKLYAYWICVNYRESYGMFASNGILFNHESPRRGEMFVTRKITKAAARIKLGLQNRLYLGNLNSKRDWGHAKDYVEGMYKIMQYEKPDDFVLATGESISVREFCKKVFSKLGMDLEFIGIGAEEKGIDRKNGKILVEVDPKFYRPAEVELLRGDSSKAQKLLAWEPKYNLNMLIDEMVCNDYELAEKENFYKNKKSKIFV